MYIPDGLQAALLLNIQIKTFFSLKIEDRIKSWEESSWIVAGTQLFRANYVIKYSNERLFLDCSSWNIKRWEEISWTLNKRVVAIRFSWLDYPPQSCWPVYFKQIGLEIFVTTGYEWKWYEKKKYGGRGVIFREYTAWAIIYLTYRVVVWVAL